VTSLPRHQQEEERSHLCNKGRTFVWCGFVLVILAVGIYFGPQTVTYWKLRPLMRSPDLRPRGWGSIPRPLTDHKASAAEGTVLSYYGCRFEVPWQGRDKEWDEGSEIKIIFKNGPTVSVVNPNLLPLGYERYKAVLSATPSQWSPFRSRKEFARFQTLLEMKGDWFEHNSAAPDIFSFETNGYRGFEISGLSHDWQTVTLSLFDSADHWFQVRLGDVHARAVLTQPEINRVIQSFGRAPAE
jgi:hypothetical protein